MVIRKHKLEYKEDFDFLLLGLASHENDYRLVWKINKSLSFTFDKSENHCVLLKDGETEMSFSHYTFDDEDTFLFYRLLANKSDKGVLLDELKNIDFLLTVQGDFSESFVTGLISNLKSIENVQGVFRISPEKLKNRERLII